MLLITGIFLYSSVSGQSQQTTALNSDSTLLTDYIVELESITNFHFYYIPSDLDSIFIGGQAKKLPVDKLLNSVLSKHNLFYSIDHKKNVYITANFPIRTDLPTGFFNKQNDITSRDTEIFSIFQNEEDIRIKNTPEEKIYEIGNKYISPGPAKATIIGHIKDIDTGEPVIGAAVYIEKPWTGVSTDEFGLFTITLPTGRHELRIKSLEMKDTNRDIILYSDGNLDINLRKDIIPLKEVIIESEKDVNVSGMQMGLERLNISAMKQVPPALGETDILKVAITLPGVQSVGESSTGLNVRGGAVDQNLILYNDAVIYNPSHLFGFFSSINPDALKNVELYKSGIPVQYGGRISSVLEVTGREGNKKKFIGSGGISLITGRFTFEGPLIQDKASFLVSARSTYSDWLLKKIENKELQNSSGGFKDFNGLLVFDTDKKNSIYLSGYYSDDKFRLNKESDYKYNNITASLKWKHIFNNKFYSILTGSYSGYDYGVLNYSNPVTASSLNYWIKQPGLKANFNFFPTSKHSIDFGLGTNYYNISPGSFRPYGNTSLITPDKIATERGLEGYVYIADRFDLNRRLSLYAGLRYSGFFNIGPEDVFIYLNPNNRTENTITDTLSYKSSQIAASYRGPEYRFSARYSFSDNASVKISFNRIRQYIHMLSNTTAMSPTDIWKLSDYYIKPQIGDQYAIGYFRNLRSNTVETSLEAYYKDMWDVLDYKSAAILVMNHHIETDVVNARGRAYGIELMIKKLTGKLNGWVSYTWSRSELKVDSNISSEVINNGEYYPSNYDKPHDFTFAGNYRFSRRFSLSLNFTYSTGRPITLPRSKYTIEDAVRLYYSNRNQYRIPDFYRADLSINIEGNHKVHKLNHSSWTLGLYNLTGRRNAYSVYFISENGIVNGYKLSIFGQPIPTITYNFKF